MLLPSHNPLNHIATRALVCSTLQQPFLNGTEIVAFSAEPNTQYVPAPVIAPYMTGVLGYTPVVNVSFCNVTMTYTHTNQNDAVTLQVWLPEDWNGRFQGIGGGGWLGGTFDPQLLPSILSGYAAASTDAGTAQKPLQPGSPSTWGLSSPGNVNWATLQDFSSVALYELSVFGKSLTSQSYGREVNYSYWNGCSQGGRQGMMLAQRSPDAYDGILAAAPALNWVPVMSSLYQPRAVMNGLGEFPPNCEFEAITSKAIAACDGLDGVYDNIIDHPALCQFDPFTLVGEPIACGNRTNATISQTAATVANETWSGLLTPQGRPLYPGFAYDSAITSVTDTDCAEAGNCSSTAWGIGADWFKYFIAKNASFDLGTITSANFSRLVHAGYQEYDSIIGTNDPDLTDLKNSGTKLLSWHGSADNYIPVGGSVQYYDRVSALDAGVHEYFKLFLAPGVGHCAGGVGAAPIAILDQLVTWVENGTSPQTVPARGTREVNGTLLERNLCAYPSVSVYQGGNASLASSYSCINPTRLM